VVRVNNYAEAFRHSRSRGDDYFVLVSFDENSRSFTAYLNLYLSDNGTLLRRVKAYRTGNDRVIDSISRAVDDLVGSLPFGAVLIRREFDRGLIDIGRFDGLTGNEELLILPQRSVFKKRDSLGYDYGEDSVVGTFTVTALDELVAEGKIETTGFFDYINEGDLVIMRQTEESPQATEDAPLEGLYQELLTIQ